MIDTNILIDASKRVPAAMTFLANQNAIGGLQISVINAMELLIGCRDKAELKRTNHFLSNFTFLHTTPSISQLALQLVESFSLSHALEIPDALIAATAVENKLPLYTKNLKHFQMIPNLQSVRPY